MCKSALAKNGKNLLFLFHPQSRVFLLVDHFGPVLVVRSDTSDTISGRECNARREPSGFSLVLVEVQRSNESSSLLTHHITFTNDTKANNRVCVSKMALSIAEILFPLLQEFFAITIDTHTHTHGYCSVNYELFVVTGC